MDREDRLAAEYRDLRADERLWLDRTITLGSIYVVAAGGTFFFLVNAPLAESQNWLYALAPYPAFTIIAIAIRHAITATARGRLLLAYERALASKDETLQLGSAGQVPVASTYHAQIPWLQGKTGGIIAIFELLPLALVLALCGLSIGRIDDGTIQLIAGIADALIALLLIWVGVDGLISPVKDSSFTRLERIMADSSRSALAPLEAAQESPDDPADG
jgi:nitrate reductase gamma subunit